MLRIQFMSTSYDISLLWMPQNILDEGEPMLTQIYVAIWRH